MNSPKLRFKNFHDEWKLQLFDDTFIFLSTNSLSRDKLNYEIGTIKNIHYGDIHTALPTICDVSKEILPYINHDSIYKNINPLKDNDLLIADASENYDDIGKAIEVIGIGNQKVVGGLHTLLLRCNLNLFATKFKGYLFNTNNVRTQIKILSSGAKVLGISKDNLKKITFYIPSLEEQTKISNFLSLIDKKIELQTQLVKNLQLYKKGLLQKVFSNNSGWKSVKLGDICNIIKGTQLNKSNLLENGLYYCLNGGITPSGYTNNWNVKENTISISEGGNSCGYVNFNKSKFWSGGHCYSLQNVTINNKYLYQFLKFKEKNIMDLRVGTGLPNIQKSSIENFEVQYPSIEEQNRIADLFTNLDKKIDFETNKLKNLKEYKKGLLQQMFI